MELSVFDLFKVGIGPSSSHTVGPMRAALRFVTRATSTVPLDSITRVRCDLFGSLALTGKGHATDKAVLLGLAGADPETVDPDRVDELITEIRESGSVRLLGRRRVQFREQHDLRFHQDELLPLHPNGLRFTAFGSDGRELAAQDYYSVGGGFVVTAEQVERGNTGGSEPEGAIVYPFTSGQDLLDLGDRHGLTIAEIVAANETAWRAAEETAAGLDRIWDVMQRCIDRGCHAEGVLPGGLNVRRRASRLYRRLAERTEANDPMTALDWVSLFALAVNEENAAGGRVVTAPTNGAAGVIPAVLAYYSRFVPHASADGVRTFLLTAAAVGMLYKRNASLSAAEMGCQGEVGVACSMAAAGLAAVMGGTNAQIENAAEIGMEHNLGLTCDPVRGLVQVPCIERNTMGAAKAVNAARLAVIYGDGEHFVPLDQAIETMRQTGHDMQAKYKETSRGGLSVNVTDC